VHNVDLVFRLLVAGLSLRRPGVRFQVRGNDIFLPAFLLCPVSINRTHLPINITAIIRTNGRSQGTVQKAVVFQKSGRIGAYGYVHSIGAYGYVHSIGAYGYVHSIGTYGYVHSIGTYGYVHSIGTYWYVHCIVAYGYVDNIRMVKEVVS
jgi:hypothetical protein